MKVGDGKEKQFLVKVKDDRAGEKEEHHLPGHQDYIQEGKIAQQRDSIDKKGKKTGLGGGPKRIIDIKCFYNPDGSCSCRDCEYLSESHRLQSAKKREEGAKEMAEIMKRILEKDKRKSGATNLGSDPPRFPNRSPSWAPSSSKLNKKGGNDYGVRKYFYLFLFLT